MTNAFSLGMITDQMQTFMSTDILNFENGNKNVQYQGLYLYLAIALPMTAFTFVAWWLIYRYVRRGQKSTMEATDSSDVAMMG
jgi:hypothetical protein